MDSIKSPHALRPLSSMRDRCQFECFFLSFFCAQFCILQFGASKKKKPAKTSLHEGHFVLLLLLLLRLSQTILWPRKSAANLHVAGRLCRKAIKRFVYFITNDPCGLVPASCRSLREGVGCVFQLCVCVLLLCLYIMATTNHNSAVEPAASDKHSNKNKTNPKKKPHPKNDTSALPKSSARAVG